METTTLKINGMTCMGCVSSVTRVLKGIPGVADATVTLDPGEALVAYDNTVTSPGKLKAAVDDAGYETA